MIPSLDMQHGQKAERLIPSLDMAWHGQKAERSHPSRDRADPSPLGDGVSRSVTSTVAALLCEDAPRHALLPDAHALSFVAACLTKVVI